jgi:hypothetical protein
MKRGQYVVAMYQTKMGIDIRLTRGSEDIQQRRGSKELGTVEGNQADLAGKLKKYILLLAVHEFIAANKGGDRAR